jgi:hypothetical protein
MDNQTRLDLTAAGALLAMLLGAFVMTVSSLGLVLMAGGAIVMLFLFLKTFREGR